MLRLGLAVVYFHSKTARQCEDHLLQLLVGMATALGVDRHIVKVVDTCDIEWDVIATFHKSQITARVPDLAQPPPETGKKGACLDANQ